MKKLIAVFAVSAVAAFAQNVENGRKIFEKIGCWECHGHVGQGGSAGPKLAPDPKPQAVISAYIRKPGGQMPPYTTKVLSEAELGDIYAYLKSIPAAKAVKDITLLNQ
jgi:ubiquinol-cytochrome c reductase cytochrome c subunit